MKLRLKYGFKMLFRKICMNYFFLPHLLHLIF